MYAVTLVYNIVRSIIHSDSDDEILWDDRTK